MRKFSLLAVAAVSILAGVGAWAASTTHARVEIPVAGGLDPHQMMLNARGLPTEHYVNYYLVFN